MCGGSPLIHDDRVFWFAVCGFFFLIVGENIQERGDNYTLVLPSVGFLVLFQLNIKRIVDSDVGEITQERC